MRSGRRRAVRMKPVLLLALSLALVGVAAAPVASAAPNCTGLETDHTCTGIDESCIGHHVYAFYEYCFGVERKP